MTGPAVDPVLRDLSRLLLTDVDALSLRMAEHIRAEEPYYRSGLGVSHEEMNHSTRDNLEFVLGTLADMPSALDAPRATGRARAEQGVPLEPVMQAFRIGGRFIWDVLIEHADPATRDSMLRSAADIWAISDTLAAAVIDAYRETVNDRARVDTQVRAALLDTLLDGSGDPAGLWDAARLLRLPRQGRFVVVSAECLSPGEESVPRVESLLHRADVASAWRVDASRQEGIVALRARFDVDRLTATVGEIAVARAGFSSTFARLDDTARAVRDARLACAAGTPGSRTVTRFAEHPVAVLLASTPDAAAALARHVLGKVLDLPADDRAMLIDTVRTWLAEAGSTSAAAGRLHMHRNTVRYRLRRIEELTGRDLTKPLDLGEVHLALESARILALA